MLQLGFLIFGFPCTMCLQRFLFNEAPVRGALIRLDRPPGRKSCLTTPTRRACATCWASCWRRRAAGSQSEVDGTLVMQMQAAPR